MQVTVYSKCSAQYPNSTRVPNLGREAHTFLHHIVSRYDSLADVNVFVMDSADASFYKHAFLRDMLANWCSDTGFYCSSCPLLGHYLHRKKNLASFTLEQHKGTTFDAAEENENLVLARVRPFGAWFAKYIGGPFPRTFCAFVMMAVSKQVIRRRPIDFYKELLSQTMDGNNVEVGHYLERSWGAIFGHP